MSRTIALLALLVMPVATAATAAEPAGAAPRSNGNTSADRACRAMDAALAAPAIQATGGHVRAEILMAAAVAYADCGRERDAFAAARDGDAVERTAYSAWVLAQLAVKVGEFATSREAFVDYARRWPEQVVSADLPLAWRNVLALQGQPEAQRDFLQQLFDAGFDPADGHASNLWHTLAILHLEAGDEATARVVAGRVMGFRNAAKMRVDRRFDRLLADQPTLGDPRAQGARLIEALTKKETAYPRSMSLRVELADEWVLMGDYAKAVAYVDASIKAVEQDEGEQWTELRHQWWLLRARSSASLRQGDGTQAIRDLERGSLMVAPGAPDVPRYALAEYFCKAGRLGEGEGLLTAAVDASAAPLAPNVAALRACLAAGRGDMVAARRFADDVATSGNGHTGELHFLALLAIGDVDAAAPRLIALLENHDTRVDVLMLVQKDRYLASLPGVVAERRTLEALLARPDVVAALAKYGRVLAWDLFLGLD